MAEPAALTAPAGRVSEGMKEGGRPGRRQMTWPSRSRLRAKARSILLKARLAARRVLAPRGARRLPRRPSPPSSQRRRPGLSPTATGTDLSSSPSSSRSPRGEALTFNECLPCDRGFAGSIALSPLHDKVTRLLYAHFTNEETQDEAERECDLRKVL